MYLIGFSGFEIVVILYCIVVVANVTHYQKFNILVEVLQLMQEHQFMISLINCKFRIKLAEFKLKIITLTHR